MSSRRSEATVGTARALIAVAWCLSAPVAAQAPALERRVTGHVMRGTRAAPIPVPGVWVVLHRVGSDHAGPLDSMRTSPSGGFSFRYRLSGDSAAIYFVAASHGGVAYFTPPFRAAVVSGDDAQITVFDTTSRPIPITVAGRHIIVGAPGPNGRRPIGEVFELQNDTTLTLITHDSVPTWTTHLPPHATGFGLNASGDIAPAAVRERNGVVGLSAPLSPGLRQFAFTYELPSDAFPLPIPIDRQIGVLELLVQEPSARVDGAHIEEIAPVSAEGRTFRRFQGQNVPAGEVLRIDIPQVVGGGRNTVFAIVAALMLATMMAALAVAARRRPLRLAAATPMPERPADTLVRAIAMLDAEFELANDPSDADRAAYAARRAELKRRLADALAASGRPR